MLSNVTKTNDVLRGATQMQDLWAEVEKETPAQGRPGPRVLQNHIMVGKVMDEQEKRDKLELLNRRRQQRNNFYISDSAKKLNNRKSSMDKEERKKVQSRLTQRPAHSPPRPKSPSNQGHVMFTGEPSPCSPKRSPKSPKSRAMVSTPGTMVESSRQRAARTGESPAAFAGLTMQDFYAGDDWRPAFEYRPAVQDKPWENVEGFAQSTRALERRKMDPYLDINSFQGNRLSAKVHARPSPFRCASLFLLSLPPL